jgi:hypothetical protein
LADGLGACKLVAWTRHFDLFHTPWFDRVIDDQIAFLRRTLLKPATTGGEQS